ncbi:FtsX-like permease family protein [Solibacillus sp. MA9]|uniref:FtsX-like permease family protein n=1 Tax=Solibacillus palustris TaxID=2908203 RepID=A0ABS9UF12_9BACL|nr:FtsX-like permease family protein [Solibacillus sp. MA9]MCH7322936.1 FtsX-like permease family protein [Solibacillus sp. MA9]
MYFKIIRNDMLKSKLITLTTVLFVASAAMLVSLAAILMVNLSGALDTLMTKAKTPHFMQMHSGEIDTTRLITFAEQHHNVDEFQIAEFLNIDGAQIILGDRSLAGSVQDNGFSIQNKNFDYLLDLDGNVIHVADGELYVPINYMRDKITKIGDKAIIGGKELTVAGFLRDSQMNSTLSASKRFLVSERDYEKIKSVGSLEYLIEFRLKDLSKLSAFETAYASAGLEANGPTVTYKLFKMMNALSDGMMIAVILLISALVVSISFMCIRFTLLAKIEDDYHEIGVMKAIGLRVSDIQKIYLAKYVVIALVGSVLGFLLSLFFKGMLLENIRLYMGEIESSSIATVLGMLGILFVFFFIIAYVKGVLKRFRKISVAEAIRFGFSQEKSVGTKRFMLSKNKLLNTNVFLGIKDVLARKRLYATMLSVFVIASFIIIVPLNLYNTISSKSFIGYMGIGNYDMRIDIQQTNNISEKANVISKKISNDPTITNYAVYTTKLFKVKMEDGSEENIKIELGNHLTFPIEYSAGRAPKTENEIALSTMNADELNKKVGDVITLMIAGKNKELVVSGIYSDITNGGKTAKATFADNSADIVWSIICTEISNSTLIAKKVSEYKDSFNFAKVSNVDEYVLQTFGSTISSVKLASKAAIVIALSITVLVTLLFMKLLVAKDRYSIAVMKSLGFTNADIKVQYVSRSILVVLVGIILGTLLANTLGEVLAGLVISSFGASSFTFEIDLLKAYLFVPLLMMSMVLIATIIGTSGAGRIKISENIKG